MSEREEKPDGLRHVERARNLRFFAEMLHLSAMGLQRFVERPVIALGRLGRSIRYRTHRSEFLREPRLLRSEIVAEVVQDGEDTSSLSFKYLKESAILTKKDAIGIYLARMGPKGITENGRRTRGLGVEGTVLADLEGDHNPSSTIAHEFGHILGLEHHPNSSNLMYRYRGDSNLDKAQCDWIQLVLRKNEEYHLRKE